MSVNSKHLLKCDVARLRQLSDGMKSIIVYNCCLTNADGDGVCKKCGLGIGIATGDLTGLPVPVVTIQDTKEPGRLPLPMLILCDDDLAHAIQNVTPVLSPDGDNPWDKPSGDNVHPFPKAMKI